MLGLTFLLLFTPVWPWGLELLKPCDKPGVPGSIADSAGFACHCRGQAYESTGLGPYRMKLCTPGCQEGLPSASCLSESGFCQE